MAELNKPIACWEQQDSISTPGSEGAGPSVSADGDNAQLSFNIVLDGGPGPKNTGSSGADPHVAQPGNM